MRILTLSLYYPPHHFGGYEMACRDAMVRLVERGHEVTVLTSDVLHPEPEPSDQGGVRVLRTSEIYVRDGEILSPSFREARQIEQRNQRRLASAIETSQPDIVAVWHMGAMSMGLLSALAEATIPIVYMVCDDWLSYGPKLDAWADAWSKKWKPAAVAKRLLRLPTRVPDLGATGAVLFGSDNTRRRSEEYSDFTFPRHDTVYVGIDLDRFPKSTRDLSQFEHRLLFVGRYDERKGIETLLRAVALLPDYRLEVRGSGDPAYQQALVRLAQDLSIGDRVEFQPPEFVDISSRYLAADITVFPSEWDEPFGLVPLESMACGTPVVATGTGGSAEFLRDQMNCLLFKAGDEAALAGAVHTLAEDVDLRNRLAANGLTTALQFGIEDFTDRLEQWYQAAAGDYPDGPPKSWRPELDFPQ